MYLPEIFKTFKKDYPEILDAYQRVGDLSASAGPLDGKTQQLVQLGISIGACSQGGVRSHARRALDEGATKEEILQTFLISLTTIGFPAAMASYRWIKEVLGAGEN